MIDRYHFKQDGAGYVLSGRHNFIYLFDIATKKLDRLTSVRSSTSRRPYGRPTERASPS